MRTPDLLLELAVLLALLLAVVATALIVLLWRGHRAALIDPRQTDAERFRTRLADEITSLLAPIAGLKEDLDGHGKAVEILGETTAAHTARLTELTELLARLERHVGDLAALVAQFRPCEACPLKVLGRHEGG